MADKSSRVRANDDEANAAYAASISPALLQEIVSAREQLLRSANLSPLPDDVMPTIPLSPPYNQPDGGDGGDEPSSLDPNSSDSFIPAVELPRVAIEYPLPAARESHEIAIVGRSNMLVLTQQSNSHLVKILLSPTTGRPLACASVIVGDLWAGLHGLCTSQIYENEVWASLQYRSLLIRIKPGLTMDCMPVVTKVIHLPTSVSGPHCVCECGPDLWTGCKDSSHMVRVNHSDPTNYSVYPCSGRPIFMARHPTSRDMYASLDSRSKIWRIRMSGLDQYHDPEEMDIPSNYGSTPVGLVAGTDGNIWFTLLGGRSGGTGTFARILHTGEFQWFSLTTPVAADAGLIHLAFDWHEYFKHMRSGAGGPSKDNDIHRLWLLSTTLVADAGHSIDAVFSVLVDSKLGRITKQQSIALPTPRCVTHRVLPHRTGIFVTELSISCLAHITGAAALKVEDVEGETTDFYHNVNDSPRFTYQLDLPKAHREPSRIAPCPLIGLGTLPARQIRR